MNEPLPTQALFYRLQHCRNAPQMCFSSIWRWNLCRFLHPHVNLSARQLTFSSTADQEPALWVSGIHIPSSCWAELSPAAIKGNGKQHSAYYNVCTNYICNVQHSPCKHTAADRGSSIQLFHTLVPVPKGSGSTPRGTRL